MERSLKQEFTRRLSQCNKGQLIIITYDILFSYLGEAKSAYEQKNYEGYKTAIRKAQACLDTLNQSLNYQYELSSILLSAYHLLETLKSRKVKSKHLISSIFISRNTET